MTMTHSQIDSLTGPELDRALALTMEPGEGWSVNEDYSLKGWWRYGPPTENAPTHLWEWLPRYNLRKDAEAIEVIKKEAWERRLSFRTILKAAIAAWLEHNEGVFLECLACEMLKALHSQKAQP